jgi:AmmeMemoRadiSam system protein A
MSIIAGYLCPHAPVFIEKVGGDQSRLVQGTIDAFKQVANEIHALQPDLIVVISPHGPIFSDAIAVYNMPEYTGNMKSFGEFTLNYKYTKDQMFIDALVKESNRVNGLYYPLSEAQFKKFQHEPKLDHGVIVPLHFILGESSETKIVAMSYGSMSYLELLKNGEILKSVAGETKKRVVVIASGDMSHALSDKGPYKYNENGPWFDQKMCENIKSQNPYAIFNEAEDKVIKAAECGLRSFAIMMGSINKTVLTSNLIHYEGPFGVGYLLARFNATEPSLKDEISEIEAVDNQKLDLMRAKAHLFVKIASETIRTYVAERLAPKYSLEKDAIMLNGKRFEIGQNVAILNEEHGVFVSIKKHGVLRGCIGTIAPTQKNTLDEIVKNAISACSKDYRFDPVSIDELEALTISVDILSHLSRVEDLDALSPEIHGVVVFSKEKMGVLLPNLEGIKTLEEQLKIASNKGGFSVDDIDEIQSFTVERFY